jgi:hypothetical protein
MITRDSTAIFCQSKLLQVIILCTLVMTIGTLPGSRKNKPAHHQNRRTGIR